MLERIAVFGVRRRRAVLLGGLLLAILCAALGATAPAAMKGGGFVAADAESSRATAILDEHFGGLQPDLILTVRAEGGVADPAARAAADAIVGMLTARADVTGIQSYWTAPPLLQPALRGKDDRTGLVLAHLVGDETSTQKAAAAIADQLDPPPGITVEVGGAAAILSDFNTTITEDLAVAEAVALPLSAIVLILMFGSVVAALLPLAIGLFSIVTTLAILRLFTMFTDVSIFALNLTSALGLALAIDYSLFIVSRYREELAEGAEPRTAAIRAVRTAGRTVWFSAVAVAIGLAGLLVFPMYFMKSLAYTSIAVVVAAALSSVLLLPALLVTLGPRIDSLDVLRRVRRRAVGARVDPESTGWYRFSRGVMRRAGTVVVLTTGVLLLLGAPFLGVAFGYPDDRVLHESSASSRAVGDELRTNFTQNAAATVYIVLPGYTGDAADLTGYATRLSTVPQVTAVISDSGVFVAGRQAGVARGVPLRSEAGAALMVAGDVDPYSKAGGAQLDAIRAIAAPVPPMITGAAAVNHDFVSSILARVPLVIALIAVTSFIVLFLFTGSVVLPLKALVMNTLSLAATFGAMVWVFQEGHLSGLLGFTPTGYLAANVPAVMFCLAFGISMDYEIFLLSRIREEWLASGGTAADNEHAVAIGIARTGRIFTAAAVLMAIVLGGLVTSKVAFIQLFGLGMAVMVIVDATAVRTLLVPAFMRLAGRYNWWAPRPLLGLRISEAPATKPVAGVSSTSE